MIKSTLKIDRYCPLVIQGFSNFLGLFQGIMANPQFYPYYNWGDECSVVFTKVEKSHSQLSLLYEILEFSYGFLAFPKVPGKKNCPKRHPSIGKPNRNEGQQNNKTTRFRSSLHVFSCFFCNRRWHVLDLLTPKPGCHRGK